MRHIATKSRSRHYGYTVQDTTGQNSSFIGPGCTGGWYKYKRDAKKRANIYNECSQKEKN